MDNMYEDFIAERLSTLRQEKGVSAREMSLAIGQNSSYINRIENRQAQPSMQCFFYICEYLNVTPSAFFEADNHQPDRINKLTAVLKTLSSQQLSIMELLAQELSRNR